MKTRLYISIAFVISIFSLIIFTSLVPPNETVEDVVTIRIREGGLKKMSSIHAIENGVETITDIEGYNTREDPVKNFKVISEVLSKYLKQGYEIQSSTTVAMGAQGTTTIAVSDYVLTR